MVKVSVLYQNTDGKKFDMQYYCDKHIPMVKRKLGDACKRLDVDQGVGGGQPGSKPAFVAMAHLLFDSVEDFQGALDRTPTKSWGTSRITQISSRRFSLAK